MEGTDMLRLHMIEKCTGAQKRKQMSRRYQPRPKQVFDDEEDVAPLNLSLNDSNSYSSSIDERREKNGNLQSSMSSLTKVQSAPNPGGIPNSDSLGYVKSELDTLKPWNENGCDITRRSSPSSEYPRNSITQLIQSKDSPKEIPKYRKPHKHTIESLLENEKPTQKPDNFSSNQEVPKQFDSYAVNTDHNKKLTVILQKITSRDDCKSQTKQPESNVMPVNISMSATDPTGETKNARYETRHNRKTIHPILYFSDSDDDEFPPVWNSRRGKKRKKRSPKSTLIKKRLNNSKPVIPKKILPKPLVASRKKPKKKSLFRIRPRIYLPKSIKAHCEICDKPFRTLSTMKKHLLLKHNKSSFSHLTFSKWIRSHYSYLRSFYRMIAVYNLPNLKKQYTCLRCQRIFKHYSTLRLHCKMNHWKGCHVPLSKFFFKDGKLVKSKISIPSWKTKKKKELKKRGRKPKPLYLKGYKKREFRCPICLKYIASNRTLVVHLLRVHSLKENEISCSVLQNLRCVETDCSYEGKSLKSLSDHARQEHPSVRHFCPYCNRGFYLEFLRDKHVLMKHKYREQLLKFACNHCGKRYLRRCHLRMHQYSKHSIPHNVQIFRCEEEGCRYTCIRRMSLIQHKSKHVKEKQYSCEYCGKRMKTAVTLRKHVSKIHLNIRPYLCQMCAQAFGEDSELQSHIKQRHTSHDEKDFFCQFCPYATSNKYSYQTHMYRVHKTRAPGDNREEFKCPHCDFVTIFGHRYRIHMNSHNNIRQYVCEFCSKAFVSSNSLRRHKLWLHSSESLSCPFCTYETKTKQSLSVHVRTQHTMKGVKPYMCRYCDFRSATGGNCRKHIMNKHKGLEVEYVKDTTLLEAAKASLDSMATQFTSMFMMDHPEDRSVNFIQQRDISSIN
ncbi:zinc finger protein 99 [Octopus sinensis]|uniref:Zinc finger protein 99 n=1 Tax=Octopus sinensis TaxID=2607531 RepID=A0A6P7S8N3_9MOLL|nr:zinc finger protein 99 [Octopus sinensis]